MSAEVNDTPLLWSPCSQHGIEQIARAAQSGMTKDAPTKTTRPIPPTTFLLIEGLSCIGLDVRIITLPDKVDRRDIPSRATSHTVG